MIRKIRDSGEDTRGGIFSNLMTGRAILSLLELLLR
jgi:hypothetical protein